MELSIDFVPMEMLNSVGVDKKIDIILNRIKEKKILVIDGKFKPDEEAMMIQKTMENVNRNFSGIEVCSLSINELMKDKKRSRWNKFRDSMVNVLTGNSRGMTIIGPAKVIKRIKREPDKISLLTKE